MGRPKLSTDFDRLQSYIDRNSTPDGCWPWTGKLAQTGYGQIGIGSRAEGTFKMTTAHRVALEFRLGYVLPSEVFALHTCDNPACCRTEPEGWYAVNGVMRRCYGHLFEGTTQDNTADRHTKQRDAAGDRNGSRTCPDALSRGKHRYNTHLTDDDVRAIRRRKKHGESTAALRREYHLGHGTFWHIIYRENWQHVLDDDDQVPEESSS